MRPLHGVARRAPVAGAVTKDEVDGRAPELPDGRARSQRSLQALRQEPHHRRGAVGGRGRPHPSAPRQTRRAGPWRLSVSSRWGNLRPCGACRRRSQRARSRHLRRRAATFGTNTALRRACANPQAARRDAARHRLGAQDANGKRCSPTSGCARISAWPRSNVSAGSPGCKSGRRRWSSIDFAPLSGSE